MTTQVLEGTWEEIARQGKELMGRRVRLLVLEDDDVATGPNRKALAVIDRIRTKQKALRFTSGETGVDIVRRGRAGEMFDNDPE